MDSLDLQSVFLFFSKIPQNIQNFDSIWFTITMYDANNYQPWRYSVGSTLEEVFASYLENFDVKKINFFFIGLDICVFLF